MNEEKQEFSFLDKKFRLRIAPSPTGDLHFGNLYVFLWNKLFTIKNNGELILRIDDTDSSRTIKGSADKIISCLKRFNIKFDTVLCQSKRMNFYNQVKDELLKSGFLYFCQCTEERLTALKENPENRKNGITYDGYCRDKELTSGVLRFKNFLPSNMVKEKYRTTTQPAVLNDVILLRTNNIPTYHFASCIDDFLLRIDLIIRSCEWLPYSYLHYSLFEALSISFGINKIYTPEFLHLPMISTEDGGKLSKRKNSENIEYFLSQGFIEEAIVNYLLSISLNHSGEEIFDINTVDITSVRMSSPKFDAKKLLWYNRQYIRRISNSEITDRILKLFPVFHNCVHLDLSRLIAEQKNSCNLINDFVAPLLPITYSEIVILQKIKEMNYQIDISTLISLCEKLDKLDFNEIEHMNDKEAFNYWKQKFNVSIEEIHMFRFLMILTEQGMAIGTLLLSLNKNWIMNRLTFILNKVKA